MTSIFERLYEKGMLIPDPSFMDNQKYEESFYVTCYVWGLKETMLFIEMRYWKVRE